MKKGVITSIFVALFILINLSSIKADSSITTNNSITLSYPSIVNYGEVFSVRLDLVNFSEDIYDIRLGLIKNSIRIARIFNGNNWQSTYYYINNAITTGNKSNETFQLNITDCYDGIADFEIKIRDSKGNLFNFYNYTINVNCQTTNDDSNDNENTDENDNYSEEDEDEINEENNPEDDTISIMLDWDSGEIINGREFEISVDFFDLEDKDYDLKVFIYDDNENSPISQVYYNNKWTSSNNYINKIFRGPQDKNEKIKLRIKDSFKEFEGEAIIGVRIRESGTSSYKEEIQEIIDIIKEEDSEEITDNNMNAEENEAEEVIDNEETQETYSEVSNEDIVNNLNLKSESIKTKKILYKSKNELVKEYSMYSFIVLGVIFLIMLVLYKFKSKM